MKHCVGDLLEDGATNDLRCTRSLEETRNYTGMTTANVGEDYVLLSDGPPLVPQAVKNTTYRQRAQVKPTAARDFHALAMQWNDHAHTSDIVVSTFDQGAI